MDRDPRSQALVALHRFGFAPKLGTAGSIKEARAVLLTELENSATGQIKNDDLQSSGEAARAAFDFRQERKAARLVARSQDQASKQQASEAPANVPQQKMAEPQAQTASPSPNLGPSVPQQKRTSRNAR